MIFHGEEEGPHSPYNHASLNKREGHYFNKAFLQNQKNTSLTRMTPLISSDPCYCTQFPSTLSTLPLALAQQTTYTPHSYRPKSIVGFFIVAPTNGELVNVEGTETVKIYPNLS